jgi:maleylpyruvate isomerase
MAPVSQPAGHSVEETIRRIDDAVGRLVASASALSDEQMREPSLLPGWSRGHVLTHIARNADGLRNLLTWAQTGVETPQYASLTDRSEQIEAGAPRPAAELAADVSSSAEAFIARARELTGEAWLAEVRASRGPAHPAWFTLHRRLFEVEVHHVDLAAGYQPADWTEWFVSGELYRITGDLAVNPQTPVAILNDVSTGRQYLLRPGEASELEIGGPGHELLAWLLGRDSGAALSADPAGPLPTIPSYG